MAPYSRPNCGELEASPVSPPNWAGLARALYTSEGIKVAESTQSGRILQLATVLKFMVLNLLSNTLYLGNLTGGAGARGGE